MYVIQLNPGMSLQNHYSTTGKEENFFRQQNGHKFKEKLYRVFHDFRA
jgi:hypothetical protein